MPGIVFVFLLGVKSINPMAGIYFYYLVDLQANLLMN